MKWSDTINIIFLISLVIVIVLEIYGIVNHTTLTITRLVLKFVPRPIIAMLLGWLCYHFLIQK